MENKYTEKSKSIWSMTTHLPPRNPLPGDLKEGHGGIIRIGFKRYACYKDEKGVLHKTSARCPHLGCELEWNPAEKTWDCPCHGSRFDYDGRLIDKPSLQQAMDYWRKDIAKTGLTG